MIKYKHVFFAFFIISIYLNANGQIPLDKLKEPPELDSTIIHGTLENGLTYYIKPIKTSSPGLKMMFLVKTGSADENPHEIGFAHHIEHLAFRETKNFRSGLKGNSKLLASLKMKASDIGGLTGDKMTEYYFNIPDNDIQLIKTGLSWFKDIATGLDLSEKNINRERGVILQEYLAEEGTQEVRGMEMELESKLFPCIVSPKFSDEHNNSFPVEDLLAFHKNWYHPDRMAIIIVGNISNTHEMKKQITNLFSPIQKSSENSKLKDCDTLKLDSKPGFSSIKYKYKEEGGSYTKPIKIQLYFRGGNAEDNHGSITALERGIMVKIIASVLSKRLKELEMVYNSPGEYFNNYTSYSHNGGQPINHFKIMVNSDLNFEKETLQKIINTLNQLKTYGINKAELNIVKEDFLRFYSEDTPLTIDYWMNEIINHIVYDEALPEEKNSYLISFLNNLSTPDFERTLQEIITEMPHKIGVLIPADYNTIISSEKSIKSIINKAFKNPVVQYISPDTPSQILTDLEQKNLCIGEVVRLNNREEGVKEFYLKNGIKVVLNPVNSQDKKIFVHGFSPFGASNLPPEDYYSAMFAPSVVKNSGIGKFSKFDMQRFYDRSNSFKMGISTYVNYFETGIKANTSKEEIEDLLQVIYLSFTKPRKDALAFTDWQSQQLYFTAISLSPNNDLVDNLNTLTKNYINLPHSSEKIEAIKRVDFEKTYEIYNFLFGDPSNFTFILTGNFEENTTLTLLQKYLGNIPLREKIGPAKIMEQPKLKSGPLYCEISPSKMYHTKNSFYGLKFVKPLDGLYDWEEELRIKALGFISHRLLYSLRSEKGLSLYYYGASGNFNRHLDRYEMTFQFNCTPEERPLIMECTREFIDYLKQGIISNEIFQYAINQLLADTDRLASKTTENSAHKLYLNYRFGDNYREPFETRNFIQSLTINDIVSTAKKYLKEQYKYELVIEENL